MISVKGKQSRVAAIFLLFLFLAVSATAPAQPLEENFFFLQMSDPQFGMHSKDKDFMQETANLDFAIATANRLKPRFVIVCGDLVNKAGEPVQISEYKRVTAKLAPRIHLYSIPGNHDVGNEPTPESIQAFRKSIGPDYFGFHEGPIYGIALNSSLLKTPEKARQAYQEQEEWLRRELIKAKNSGALHILVFLHHPLFLEQPGEPDQYFNIPLERRTPLLKLLQDAGVKFVFAGHYHRNAQGTSGELQMVTTGPVGMPLGEAKSGLRVVWAEGNELKHRYFDFGALPAVIPPTKQ